MKRMLYSLMLCLVSIIIVGCSKDQPVTTTGQTVTTGSALDDSDGNCMVTIEKTANSYYGSISDLSIIIKDKNGNQKGAGQFFGDYYVPYDGTIDLSFTVTYDSNSYNFSCSIPVGSANALNVSVGNGAYSSVEHYVYVSVGGITYRKWDY